jgi:hypothetical protein
VTTPPTVTAEGQAEAAQQTSRHLSLSLIPSFAMDDAHDFDAEQNEFELATLLSTLAVEREPVASELEGARSRWACALAARRRHAHPAA